MDAVCKLIQKTMSYDELHFPTATETSREVMCKVDSVSRSEYFNAGKAGLTPEYVFTINRIEYNGESELEYESKRYGIYRTYKTDDDMMELYAEYKSGVTDVDRTPPTPPQEENNVGD